MTKKYEGISISDRQRRKFQAELKRMQWMWIPQSRMTDRELEFLKNEDLAQQIKIHSDLWAEYPNKPQAPKVCATCKMQVGKYEYPLVATPQSKYISDIKIWYNDECKLCLTGDDGYGT